MPHPLHRVLGRAARLAHPGNGKARRVRVAILLCGLLLAGMAPTISAQTRKRPPREWTWIDPDTQPPAPMRYKTFRSEAAGGDVSYLVYLPPGYDTSSTTRYPTIYWMHGLNGRQAGGARLAGHLDEAIRAGRLSGLIVVSVNGLRASMYCDSKDGKWPVETVITKDLVRHIDSAYRTVRQREARAVAGMSMGGFGTLHLGAKYPDLFGVWSSLAAALHTEDSLAERRTAIFQQVAGGDKTYMQANTPWTLVKQNAAKIRDRTMIRVIIGTDDGLLGWNREFHQLLDSLGIAHQYTEVLGVGHNYRRLAEALAERTIEFYRKAFGERNGLLFAPGGAGNCALVALPAQFPGQPSLPALVR